MQTKTKTLGQSFHRRAKALTLCINTLLLAVQVQAANQAVNYEKGEAQVLPEGCGSAFQEVAKFMDFYESAASLLVAKRGASARGAVDLFAVLRLREKLLEMNSNYSSESPIDRLVIAQICQFQKIRAQEQLKGASAKNITSSDEDLLDHLAAIAPKLLEDSKNLVKSAMRDGARQRELDKFLDSKKEDINQAKAAGARKADSLIGEN